MLQEDVVDSEELVGVDFTHMLPYLDMAYGEESGLWFKLDASSNGMGDGDEDMSEEQCERDALRACSGELAARR